MQNPGKRPALRGKISAKSPWLRGIENNDEQQMNLVIWINFFFDKPYSCELYSPLHYRPSTSPPYILHSTTAQYRSSVYSAVHHRHGTNSPNTLHSTTVKVPVLRIRYNSLNTQHQTYVCFPVQFRPSTSPAYTVQSTTNQYLSPVYSPLQTQYQS